MEYEDELFYIKKNLLRLAKEGKPVFLHGKDSIDRKTMVEEVAKEISSHSIYIDCSSMSGNDVYDNLAKPGILFGWAGLLFVDNLICEDHDGDTEFYRKLAKIIMNRKKEVDEDELEEDDYEDCRIAEDPRLYHYIHLKLLVVYSEEYDRFPKYFQRQFENISLECESEHVGSQDQVAAAFGGFNKITFNGNHNIDVVPIVISDKKLQNFQSHLMLFFTGFQRNASEVEEKKIKQIKKKKAILGLMHNMVDEAIKIINEGDDISDFGKMLHENWKLKKSLSGDVSTDIIDDIYDTAINNGAIGGKILGAGRGGFMLFFVKPEDQGRLKNALSNLLYVPFKLDTTGSQIIFYSRSGV